MIGKRSSSSTGDGCVRRLWQGKAPEMRMRVVQALNSPQEGHPVDRLSELLGQAVQFAYTCWDRIVLSGYIERLQRPENLIYFFHDVVGIDRIEPAVLEQRTGAYKTWVRRITDERGIPVLAAPRGVKKEELVEPYYRRLKGGQGVACVLTSMEQGRTFVSYVPRWKVPKPRPRWDLHGWQAEGSRGQQRCSYRL